MKAKVKVGEKNEWRKVYVLHGNTIISNEGDKFGCTFFYILRQQKAKQNNTKHNENPIFTDGIAARILPAYLNFFKWNC